MITSAKPLSYHASSNALNGIIDAFGDRLEDLTSQEKLFMVSVISAALARVPDGRVPNGPMLQEEVYRLDPEERYEPEFTDVVVSLGYFQTTRDDYLALIECAIAQLRWTR